MLYVLEIFIEIHKFLILFLQNTGWLNVQYILVNISVSFKIISASHRKMLVICACNTLHLLKYKAFSSIGSLNRLHLTVHWVLNDQQQEMPRNSVTGKALCEFHRGSQEINGTAGPEKKNRKVLFPSNTHLIDVYIWAGHTGASDDFTWLTLTVHYSSFPGLLWVFFSLRQIPYT